jgi:hypothetical protein
MVFRLLDFFDELYDGPVLVVGDIDFIIIFCAFDLMLYNNMIGVNIYFLLDLEDLGGEVVRDFVDYLSCIIMHLTLLALQVIRQDQIDGLLVLVFENIYHFAFAWGVAHRQGSNFNIYFQFLN